MIHASLKNLNTFMILITVITKEDKSTGNKKLNILRQNYIHIHLEHIKNKFDIKNNGYEILSAQNFGLY